MISERLEAPDAVRHQHELALRAQEFVPLTAHDAQTLRHLDAATSWGVDEIARRDSWVDAAIRSDEVSEPSDCGILAEVLLTWVGWLRDPVREPWPAPVRHRCAVSSGPGSCWLPPTASTTPRSLVTWACTSIPSGRGAAGSPPKA